MKVDLLIKNGTIVTPDHTFQGSIAVKDGKIAAIITGSELPEATEVYDATGKVVTPGLIDGHVHFREPGVDYKEDFATGTAAAACGGITTVIDMPNVKPPTSTVEYFDMKVECGKKRACVDYGVFAVILQENLKDLIPLSEAGIVGYKIFLGATIGNIPAPDDGMMYEEFQVVAKTGLRTGFHAENNEMINHETKKLKDAGVTDPACFPQSRPAVAEADAIAKVIRYAEYTGAKMHIYHLSSKEGVALIRDARKRGIDITAETGPHYLLKNVDDYAKVGGMLKMNPPVRYKEDSEALWEGLNDGTLQMIATDHSPHTPEEKIGNIWEATPGFCAVEIAVPLILTAVNEGRMSINQYVRCASENPAKVWGMYPQKGSLLVGTDADITVIDMDKAGVIENAKLHSKNKVSPYDGDKYKGAPVATIVRGMFVMKDGEFLGTQGFGQLVKPCKA